MTISRSKFLSTHVKEVLNEEYIEADRIILVLLFLHWIVATFLASLTYGTQMYGFISGGIIVLINVLLYSRYKGTNIVRNSLAVSMMLFSLIFIQQQLGRIEIHFHVFIVMAFLTLYKDTYPIILAATTTLIHHALFNYLQLMNVEIFDTPVILYSYGCGWDITILHALFVIVEALVLVYIVKRQNLNKIALIESEQSLKLLHNELQKENKKNKKLAKESQQFSSALDQSSIISKTDTRGIITYVNQRFCDVSGYTKEELIGKNHNIIRHPNMSSEVFRSMWETIQSKNIFRMIIQNINKNNESYYVDSTIIPILNVDNEIDEYLAVRYDVTDLIKARDEALKSQRAKDRFVATMSHELRTPLNAIIGFTKLAKKKVNDKEVNEYLDVSLDSSYNLLTLINNILDISKMQSGKFSIIKHKFNPSTNFKNLLKSFEELSKAKNIDIEFSIDNSLDRTLFGDWQLISQIITNLISNAIKFTPSNKSIKIESSLNNNLFVCSVKDTGIGLSKEAQKRIFKPFEQANTATTREHGGTGLGLSISLELANMMNGTLSVDSIEGEGSTFILTIPLEAVEDTKESEIEEADVNAQVDKQLSGRILVAEDNKTNQMLIKIMLNDAGLDCDIAKDGVEAVKMYGEKSYDLVLMDENMPNMSGIDAMKSIHKKYGDVVPIIALTANNMKGDRERFLDAGMDDYVGKPIDDQELFSVIEHYLNNK